MNGRKRVMNGFYEFVKKVLIMQKFAENIKMLINF